MQLIYILIKLGEKLMKKTNSFLIISTTVLLAAGVLSFKTVKFHTVKAAAEDFSITTDLEAEKQIHTDRQATYLAYDGDFDTIPEANYPDGQQHLSDPEPVNLAWNYNVPAGKTLSRYDVIVGKEADLSDGYAIKGTTATNLNVYNSYLGDNYFQVVANFSDGTKDSSEIKKYKVENIYPRNLKIDGMTNCRDMGGGRELVDGGYIKQGLLYRTSSTSQWAYGRGAVPDTITDAGKEELLVRLGCKTEINVNNSGSSVAGIQNYVQAYMYYDNGKHHLYRNAEPLKEVFHALANPDNYPIFYHCRIGTDRTGLCAIMISGLLGVPENLIYQDYLFSNFGNIQEKRYIGEKAGRDNIMNYINDLKAFPGEKFQNKVYNYLLSIGIPASELNSVINILVEGNKPNGNNNYQELILASDMDGVECEAKTTPATSNAHPDVYYTLGAEQGVYMEFDAKYSDEAYLVAYLGSTDTTATKKIADSIEARIDGEEIEVDEDLTFASVGFGQGDGRTYYSAVVLGKVDVYKGPTSIEITGKANNLNIGAVSIIPVNKIIIDEEIPGPVVPDTSEGPSDSQPNKEANKGCGGSIIAASSLVSMFALGVVALISTRRKED